MHNVRVVPIVMPSTRIISSPALQYVIFEVPLNDTRTATFGATYRPDGQPFDKKKADENGGRNRSEEHTSELQSLMRISYAVFCLKKKKNRTYQNEHRQE